MSRSPVASKFTALVGTPPHAYLTNWRMNLAAVLLQGDHTSVGQTAAQIGYASEAAFSKAFKRQLGTSPIAYRRRFSAETADRRMAA